MTNTKHELLEAEDAAWRELHALFDGVGDRWDDAGATGDWTPRDVLAHIASWHAVAVSLLEQHRTTGTIVRPFGDVDEYNAKLRADCAGVPLADVFVMATSSRHRFLEEAALLPAEPTAGLAGIVGANGHDHYAEHIPLLTVFLAGDNA